MFTLNLHSSERRGVDSPFACIRKNYSAPLGCTQPLTLVSRLKTSLVAILGKYPILEL